MKLKTLAVITLVVLGCSFASAQTGTFSFWNAAGTAEYCDYFVITTNSGGVVAGYDDTTNVCGFEFNSAIVGFDATTPNDGLPGYGKGVVVGDDIYDASCACFSGLQWTVWVSDKCSKKKNGHFTGRYGWVGVAGSYSGVYLGDSYGYLACGAPDKGEVAGHGTIAGKLPNKLRK